MINYYLITLIHKVAILLLDINILTISMYDLNSDF